MLGLIAINFWGVEQRRFGLLNPIGPTSGGLLKAGRLTSTAFHPFDSPPDTGRRSMMGSRLFRGFQSRTNVSTNVELAFSERSLRQLCESKVVADRKLGAKIAERLRRRVADLHAAAFVSDLVTGQPQDAEDDLFVVRVIDDCSITFSANHSAIPRLASGKVNWRKVSRVKIVKIGASNEQC